ncbi:hypothetical protein O6H91_05G036000 [Diphasiastrum complanatum]|nr:hypothetical protein O6H91_05G036000 [Diphasiastrum complanatum]
MAVWRCLAQEMSTKVLDPSLYPLHRCKIIHLVRHAQGYHNVAGELDQLAYISPEFFDATLTPLGWKQVDALRKHVADTKLKAGVELVVVSPLSRTMQTAVGVFGGNNVVDGEITTPLMVEGVRENHPAISSSASAPFVAVEWCREHMGVHPCDRRQSASIYKKLFPAIDFSELETDEDSWWKADVRESHEDIYSRCRALIKWLLNRSEKQIAIVSHSSFLAHLVSLFGDDCTPVIKNELHNGYANCELRTVLVADRRAIGKPSITTDFPGGIPGGPSAGSDLADSLSNGPL